MIGALIGSIFIFLFVAALSVGFAWLLDSAARRLGVVLRSIIAAFSAGAITLIIPVLVLADIAQSNDLFATLLPLFLGAALLAIFFGFPSAYFFSRRRTQHRESTVDPSIFE